MDLSNLLPPSIMNTASLDIPSMPTKTTYLYILVDSLEYRGISTTLHPALKGHPESSERSTLRVGMDAFTPPNSAEPTISQTARTLIELNRRRAPHQQVVDILARERMEEEKTKRRLEIERFLARHGTIPAPTRMCDHVSNRCSQCMTIPKGHHMPVGLQNVLIARAEGITDYGDPRSRFNGRLTEEELDELFPHRKERAARIENRKKARIRSDEAAEKKRKYKEQKRLRSRELRAQKKLELEKERQAAAAMVNGFSEGTDELPQLPQPLTSPAHELLECNKDDDSSSLSSCTNRTL